MLVELFDTSDSIRMDAALSVRIAVFVNEQGVPMEEEIDQHDRSDIHAVHALVRDENGDAIAAGRYYVRDSRTAQIGRMAVLARARGKGLGAAILQRLVDQAEARGFTRASLNAQVQAIPFYERFGFSAEGARYEECGIPHQAMSKSL